MTARDMASNPDERVVRNKQKHKQHLHLLYCVRITHILPSLWLGTEHTTAQKKFHLVPISFIILLS